MCQICFNKSNSFLAVQSLIYLITGAVLMTIGIFRFTFYRRQFTRPLRVAGFSLSPDAVSILFFVVGFALILLFAVNEIQPLFYKGRDLRHEPGNY